MAIILEDYALTYDDIVLKPRYSAKSSRFNGEVSLNTKLLPNLVLPLPIIAANMDTISGPRLTNEIWKLGGLAVIHRFQSKDTHRNSLETCQGTFRIGCIGIGIEGLRRAETISGASEAFLVDIAHGHSKSMIDQIKAIRELYPSKPIIAGNVATYEGTIDLIKAGASCIKVGVGPGCACTTRVHTGNGVPQVKAILEARRAIEDLGLDTTIIADGGCRSSGDIVKALALGANAVMLGGMLAGIDEAIGEEFITPQGVFKLFRGMASLEAQKDWKGVATSIEGEATLVKSKGPLKEVLDRIVAGIRSGFTYQNAGTINELQDNAVFYRQTHAGFVEGTPHGKK